MSRTVFCESVGKFWPRTAVGAKNLTTVSRKADFVFDPSFLWGVDTLLRRLRSGCQRGVCWEGVGRR